MRGISLDEIAASTKINLRFLESIENDDFASIPGGIFRRSFIRAYARYLGLDEEQVVAEYQIGTQPEDVGPPMLLPSSASARSQRRPLLVPVILAALMLTGGYWLFRYAHRADDFPPANPSNAPAQTPSSGTDSAALAERSPAIPGDSEPQTAIGTPGNAASANAQPPQAGTLAQSAPAATQGGNGASTSGAAGIAASADMILQVAATERVWVSVDADGKMALQRTLNPQDSQTVKAKDHFDVTTGNAQGLILTLNGETLKPLGRQGEVKRVRLKRSGLTVTP